MRLLEKARQSQLVRNVAVLATGTALAQAITVLASPVLTRLYSPEAFGFFATFIALVTSIAPAITGKYEVALMLPRSESAARQLFAVAVWIGVALSAVFLVIAWITITSSASTQTISELGGWVLVAPFALLCTGFLNLTGFVANRRGQYRFMARSSIIQATAAVSVNIALGIAGASFGGLIIGNLSGLIAALSYLTATQLQFIRRVSFPWTIRKRVLVNRYRSFPVYNASTGFLGGVTVNLPIFFMMAYFTPEVAGSYALVTRVMSAPLSFISSSVSRINLKKVVDLANDNGDIRGYLLKAAATLLAISLPPALLFVFWGPPIFSFVFGQEWLQAGQISQALALAVTIKFVSSTMSTTLGATNNNKYGAIWRVVAFTSTLVVLGLAAQTESVSRFILALVLNEIALYSFYFYLILQAARNPKN